LHSPATDEKVLGYKLFHRIILESGSSYNLRNLSPTGANFNKTIVSHIAIAQSITNSKTDLLRKMRSISPKTLVKQITPNYRDPTENKFPLHPCFDGYIYPKSINEALKKHEYRDVDILFGYNTEEAAS
jgi:carboxylesterase type B